MQDFTGEVKDLISQLDNMFASTSKYDLARLTNSGPATSQLMEYNGILQQSYTLQDKMLAILDTRQKYNDEQIKYYTQLIKDQKTDIKQKEALEKWLKTLEKRNDELNKQRKEAIEDTKDYSDLLTKQGMKTKALSIAHAVLGKAYGVVMAAAAAYMYVLRKLAAVEEKVFKWQNDLQKSLSGLAIKFGSTTEAVVAMRDEGLSQLLDVKGLGGLGMSLEDIVGQLSAFQEALGWTDRMTQKSAADMLKFGLGIGFTAQQSAELTKSMMLQGQSLQDTKDYMKSIGVEARRAGVSAMALGKQFQGAGKALWSLSGPEARKQLVITARELAKLGTGLDKLAGFTNMTLSFDQTVESMAKLNTAFGTHVNAMDMFMDQDPASQFEKIKQALEGQGKSLATISKYEKSMLMSTLQMDADTIDSLIQRSTMTEAELKALEKKNDMSAKLLEAQNEYEKSIGRTKTMLIAEQTITANINTMLTKQMAPFYKGWAKGGGILGGAEAFDSYVQKWTTTLNRMNNALGEQGMGGYLSGIGRSFGAIWDTIMDFVSSDSMAAFLTGIMAAFEIITDLISGILVIVSPLLKGVAWLIGKTLEVIGAIWKLAKIPIVSMFVGAQKGTFMDQDTTDSLNADAKQAILGTGGMAEQDVSPADVGLTGLATGGPTSAGAQYLVGEKGPELFTSNTGGTITPAAETAKALSGRGGSDMAEIHVHVTLDGEKLQDTMYKSNLRRQQ